jgi:fluoride exporter
MHVFGAYSHVLRKAPGCPVAKCVDLYHPDHHAKDGNEQIRHMDYARGTMEHAAYVVLGGGLGSLLRYLTGIMAIRLFGPFLPWGTFTVNIVGSFFIGLLMEWIARKLNASADMQLFLVTGVMGGFTTFSSFSLDVISLAERGELLWAMVYVLATVGLGIVAVFGGLAVGRAIF